MIFVTVVPVDSVVPQGTAPQVSSLSCLRALSETVGPALPAVVADVGRKVKAQGAALN